MTKAVTFLLLFLFRPNLINFSVATDDAFLNDGYTISGNLVYVHRLYLGSMIFDLAFPQKIYRHLPG
jgi:hypothetical protein